MYFSFMYIRNIGLLSSVIDVNPEKDLEFVMLTTGLFLSKEKTDVVNPKSCSDVGKSA